MTSTYRYHRYMFGIDRSEDEYILHKVFLLYDFDDIEQLTSESMKIVESFITYLIANCIDISEFNIPSKYKKYVDSSNRNTIYNHHYNFQLEYTDECKYTNIIELLKLNRSHEDYKHRREFKYKYLSINDFTNFNSNIEVDKKLWYNYLSKVALLYKIDRLIVEYFYNNLFMKYKNLKYEDILRRDLDVFSYL